MKDILFKEGQNIKDRLVKISEFMYHNPELGNKEFKSIEQLISLLEENNFKVEKEFLGLKTAFRAVYDSNKPGLTVGYLCEYDALPEIGHGCGHNMIGTMSAGAGVILSKILDEVGGRIIVYGTPAEELDGSKHYILAGGFMDEVDLMFANHYGKDWCSEVTGKAIVWPLHDKWVTFTGKPSHASATPHNGRSALDAVLLTCMGLEFLREHTLETDRIHYIISNGGTAANSVPDKATLNVELRANNSAELNDMMRRVDNVIKGAELMTDTKADYKWDSPWYCATPVPSFYRAASSFAPDLGLDESRFTFGNMPQASSDLGCVAYKIPTIEITFPIVKDDEIVPVGHSNELAAISGNEFPIDQSILAGKLMALTAYRIGTNPEKLEEIKAEFQKNYKE